MPACTRTPCPGLLNVFMGHVLFRGMKMRFLDIALDVRLCYLICFVILLIFCVDSIVVLCDRLKLILNEDFLSLLNM